MNRLTRKTVSGLAALAVSGSLAWAVSVHDTASPVPSTTAPPATTDALVPSSTTAPTPSNPAPLPLAVPLPDMSERFAVSRQYIYKLRAGKQVPWRTAIGPIHPDDAPMGGRS